MKKGDLRFYYHPGSKVPGQEYWFPSIRVFKKYVHATDLPGKDVVHFIGQMDRNHISPYGIRMESEVQWGDLDTLNKILDTLNKSRRDHGLGYRGILRMLRKLKAERLDVQVGEGGLSKFVPRRGDKKSKRRRNGWSL
jgi:hypothetical protein